MNLGFDRPTAVKALYHCSLPRALESVTARNRVAKPCDAYYILLYLIISYFALCLNMFGWFTMFTAESQGNRDEEMAGNRLLA